MTDKTPKWVISLMRQAIKDGLTQRDLADILDVKQPNVGRYLSGTQTPNINVVSRLLKHMGGDVNRALPDWEPDTDQPESKVYGQVQAGSATFAGESIDVIRGLSDEVWKSSIYWSMTTGQTIMLQVVGDSMSPFYEEGEFLACRKPSSVRDILDGTPCIFKEDGNLYTFKIFRKSKTNQVVAIPLNNNHPPIVYDIESDFEVAYMVLGKIDCGHISIQTRRGSTVPNDNISSKKRK